MLLMWDLDVILKRGQMDMQIRLKLQQNLTQQKHADLQITTALADQHRYFDYLFCWCAIRKI